MVAEPCHLLALALAVHRVIVGEEASDHGLPGPTTALGMQGSLTEQAREHSLPFALHQSQQHGDEVQPLWPAEAVAKQVEVLAQSLLHRQTLKRKI